MYRSGEERLVQEVVKTVVLVQERRGEAYRRWCKASTGGGKESPSPGLYGERN